MCRRPSRHSRKPPRRREIPTGWGNKRKAGWRPTGTGTHLLSSGPNPRAPMSASRLHSAMAGGNRRLTLERSAVLCSCGVDARAAARKQGTHAHLVGASRTASRPSVGARAASRAGSDPRR
eukprot:5503064-Prymnesium_polylepis.1